MNDITNEQSANNIGVSDTPTAKALIQNSENLVSPDPVTRPGVGTFLADSAGGKLHNTLLDVLKPKNVPLTADQAKRAVQAGIDVQKAPDGSLYRVVKPDMTTADNFRRFLGKVLDGKVEGYEAINRQEASSMYKGVSDAMDEYAKGASKPVQANWAAGKAALKPFEQVREGQNIVGMQKGTDVARVPSSRIPGQIVAGGRDTMQQAAAVSGQAPVAAAMRSQVQNALTGVKGSAAIFAKVAPGTTLHDIINPDDALSAAVREYVGNTKASEAAAAQAENLGQRAVTSGNRAAKFNKIADALQGTSQEATATANSYARDLANLEIADPKYVGAIYSNMLDKAHAAGTIDTNAYLEGKKLVGSAQKDFALKSTRNKWMLGAAGALGISQIPGGFHSAVGLLKAATGTGN